MYSKNKRTKRHPNRKGCFKEEVEHLKVVLVANKCMIKSKIILKFKDLEIFSIVTLMPLKWRNLKIQPIQFKFHLQMGISPQLDLLYLGHLRILLTLKWIKCYNLKVRNKSTRSKMKLMASSRNLKKKTHKV